MKLTMEQIKSILFGAVELAEEGGALAAYKCTAPVRAAWRTVSEGVGKNACPPTGVRLDFVTDGEEVTFTLIGKPFDCLVDGLLTDRFEGSEEPEDFTVTLDGEQHRVTLIFPSHNVIPGRLCGVTVPDDASVEPHEYGEKFLFFGRFHHPGVEFGH